MKLYFNNLSKTAKIPFLLFIYAISFSMLLTGIKYFHPDGTESPEEIQENIADNIIRLHVIANSDTDTDQSLKLKVRDGIIEQLQDTIAGTSSAAGAEKLLASQEDNIKNSALDIISGNGYNYPVNVSLEERYFPVKSYGDLIFPAGNYKALCVEIGEAKGRNWWCVLFPSLCFVDETYAVVPDSSKEKLKETLSEEEYESLSQDSKKDSFFIHSAIYDWFCNKTGL
ncbi:MAG: stage II sporulation protein R [Lachnospiraceae bacterium]|jgi:stage II sporulation protein R|nr:stage II sporulation protein R [Lachnospiraceae bacterium]